MKIIHLLNSNQFSGAENVVCQIIGMFGNEKDINMLYVSPDGPIREALKERNVNFLAIEKLTINEIKRIICEEKPDIIHAHDMRASVFAALAAGNIKVISHIHNNAYDSRKLSIKSVLYLLVVRKAEHIFWVSNNALKDYKFSRFCLNKSTVLCNVIDLDALKKKKELDNNLYDSDIVYVGRLSYPKNPQRLLNVIKIVVEKIPCVKVNIVGNGELEHEIKLLAQKYNIDKNVEFMGFQMNPLKIMSDSKVMLMTSRWEGVPMCALEAMTLGLPIVSTRTDGLNYLIEHGITGFLSDDDYRLANYIISLLEDKTLHAKMSDNAIKAAMRINNQEKYKAELLRAWYGN